MAKKIDYAGMFTLRKDGRYQGYWYDSDGVRHAACDRDPETLYKKLKGKEAPHVVTFREIAEAWQVEHVEALGRGSQSTYRAPLAEVISLHGDKPIAEITAGDINRELLAEKAKGYSYKHAATRKSIYKQIFDYAIIKGHIYANPTQSVKVPRGMVKGHREAPETDIVKVIKAHLSDPGGDFVAVLLYTGMRTQEAVALRWSDIDTKNSTIHVRDAIELHGKPLPKETKTEAGERDIPLLKELTPFLQKPGDAKASDYVFNRDGRLLTRGQISSLWLTWCKSAGLAEQKTFENRHRGKKECARTEWRPTVTPHQLRHNYATVLFEAEIDELTAKDLMGHTDIAMTRAIYTSLRKAHRDSEIKKLQLAFDGNSDGA